MQILAGHLLLSATDLVNFLGCRHATYLDLRDLADPVEIPERDAATVLIFAKGIEHEKRHLASLKAVRALAALPLGSRVPGIQPETLNRLQHQATLQIAKRETGKNQHHLLPPIPGKGFARLPRPDPGDIFFDMEGYQFFDDRSNLEYLFGFVTVNDGQPRFAATLGT